MGFRIPAVLVSPFARRGHVDHSIYGFESILKLIRYRYGLPPLTPRDLYANNIAPLLRLRLEAELRSPGPARPAERRRQRLHGEPGPAGAGGTGGGGVAEEIEGLTGILDLKAPARPKEHDLATLKTSGYLERLGFDYKPATPARRFRHPSKLGLKP